MTNVIEVRLTHEKPWQSGNQIKRMHWAVERGLKQQYAKRFMAQAKPMEKYFPLVDVAITAVRHSSGELDNDNLIAGLKLMLDAITVPTKRNPFGMGLILDDRPIILKNLNPEQVKLSRKNPPDYQHRSELIVVGTPQRLPV